MLVHDIQMHSNENPVEHRITKSRHGLLILQFMPLAACARLKDNTQNILQCDEISKNDATNLRSILAVEPVTRLWKQKIKDGRKVTAVHRPESSFNEDQMWLATYVAFSRPRRLAQL